MNGTDNIANASASCLSRGCIASHTSKPLFVCLRGGCVSQDYATGQKGDGFKGQTGDIAAHKPSLPPELSHGAVIAEQLSGEDDTAEE